jgi:glucosamine-6-phosphate deaminase
MQIFIDDSKTAMGKRAAAEGAERIRKAIAARGSANIIVATGASQFEMLEALVSEPGINWNLVTGFHLDEYVGLPITHPASFRGYLWQRFISKLPQPLKAFHYVEADAQGGPQTECQRLGQLIKHAGTIDVAFIGIGENAHLAFNDPPADFETDEPYLVVTLDEACRKQQMGEGWFPTMNDVPTKAISMSIRQIMKSKHVVCTVPDARKAEAVKAAVEGPVINTVPASMLQKHASASLYLDRASASGLTDKR